MHSIRIKLAIAFAAMALLPLLVAGGVLVVQTRNVQIDETMRFQREVNLRVSGTVIEFVHTALDHLRLLVLLENLARSAPDRRDEMLALLGAHRDDSHRRLFEDILLVDPAGRTLGCASQRTDCHVEEPPFDVPVILKAIRHEDKYMGPVRFDETTGIPFMTVAIAERSAVDGSLEAVLATRLRLKEIWELVAQVRVGRHGVTYLTNENGRVLAHPDPSVVLRGDVLSEPGGEGVRPGLAGNEAVLVSQNLSFGTQHLVMITERPLDEVLDLVRRTLLDLAVILLGAFVLAALCALIVSKWFVLPIDLLGQRAAQIARGQFSGRVDLERDDELGALGRAFNAMSAKIEEQIKSLRAMLRERDQALKRLSASYDELEQYTHVSSHHLQEPIRVMVNSAELVQRTNSDVLDEMAARRLNTIRQRGIILLEMLNGMLLFASLSKRELKLEHVDAEQMTVALVRALLQQDDMPAFVLEHDPLPVIRVDRHLFELLLGNLLENAAKFRRTEPHTIHVAAKRDHGGWVISVSDNGLGMNPEYVDRIFGIFKRLHTLDAFPGTGIGLAMCRKIVELHGGKIWVRTKPGYGSTFLFSLPDNKETST